MPRMPKARNIAGGLLVGVPLFFGTAVYPPKLRPEMEEASRQAIKAVVTGMQPELAGSLSLPVRGKSLASRLLPGEDAAFSTVPYRHVEIGSGGTDYAGFLGLVGHEALHDPRIKTRNNEFMATAVGNYMSGFAGWHERPARRGLTQLPGGVYEGENRGYSATQSGWLVKAIVKGKPVTITRGAKGFVISPFPGTKKAREYPIAMGEIGKYLHDRPTPEQRRLWKKIHSSTRGSESYMDNDAGVLGTHCAAIERVFQRPGMGMTILRRVGQGMPLVEAEKRAIAGEFKLEEEAFRREALRAAGMMLKAIPNRRQPSPRGDAVPVPPAGGLNGILRQRGRK